ncbi:WD repeat-containing protein 78-like [Huso huso]|uniref:WD repeat-containing protein 78-like n=1 Tax=Huso huso TaxID=61971 RepID=A0ABR0Y519_HUSHU
MALGLFVTPQRFLISSWAPQFREVPERHALSATPSAPPSLEPRTEGGLSIRDVLDCGCDVMTCCFNDEGTLLAVGLTNGTIQVYQPADSTFLYQLNSSETLQSSLPVTSLRFQHRDNRERHCLLLATYASGCVRVWHVAGGRSLCCVQEGGGDSARGRGRQTLSLSLSPSGDRFITAGSDCQLHLYDTETRQRIHTCRASHSMSLMDGHRFRVFAVTFHPEKEDEFISGGWDNTVQFWDSKQQHSVRKLSGPHICGDALQIDPSTNQILSGSWRKERALEVWDYNSGEKVTEISDDQDGHSLIYSCHWLGADHMVAGGSESNVCRVIDRNTKLSLGRLVDLPGGVYSTAVCSAGQCEGLIAASSRDCVYLLERTTAPTTHYSDRENYRSQDALLPLREYSSHAALF